MDLKYFEQDRDRVMPACPTPSRMPASIFSFFVNRERDFACHNRMW
jgi:hypothetical protein